jgi:lipopolysaccharide export system permease protein
VSAIVAFFSLSAKSEITIIRSSGFSMWQTLEPVAIVAFLLGIFWITIFGIISIQMTTKFNNLDIKYFKNESREILEPKGGIWIKQKNLIEENEEIIIRGKRFYKKECEFINVELWFFNKNGGFYKKIDAKKLSFKENDGESFWIAEGLLTNSASDINQKTNTMKIATDLDKGFIFDKIVNNFQNVRSFSIFRLPSLISEMSRAGFSSTKFNVYFHNLLSKPILFIAMILIGYFFGVNNFRNKMSIMIAGVGVIIGLVIYVVLGIISTLGSSAIISCFASTWVATLIVLSAGVLLIYEKENFN